MDSKQSKTQTPEPAADLPLVTLALFAFNQEKYVREAVRGAFSQTYQPLEIILSDDFSTDGTYQILQEMATAYRGPHKVRVRRSDVNRGLAGHINDVVGEANGEIISWAAGDDIALPKRTAVFVSKLLEREDHVGVHSDVEEIDLDGKFIRFRTHSDDEAHPCLDRVVSRGQSVITQSHAFRKKVFDAFGPFRDDLTQEGIAMAFRECAIGKVVFVREALTKYRIGSGVSTYSGADVTKRKVTEPIKYTNWYLSAFRQMRDDVLMLPEQPHIKTRKLIEKNICFYSSLMEINTGKSLLRPIIKNFLIAPGDLRSIRAAIRRAASPRLYKYLAR